MPITIEKKNISAPQFQSHVNNIKLLGMSDFRNLCAPVKTRTHKTKKQQQLFCLGKAQPDRQFTLQYVGDTLLV